MNVDLISVCETRFMELSERYGDGDLTEQQFRELVAGLLVHDRAGVIWQLSPDSGKWMRMEGSRWMEGGRPAYAVAPGGIHAAQKDIDEIMLALPADTPPKGFMGWFGPVFRYVLGAILLVWGAGLPLLGIFGQPADGVVTSVSRTDTTEDGRSGIFTVNYRFTIRNESTFFGVSLATGNLWGTDGVPPGEHVEVRYLPGVPFLNAASWDTELSISHLLIALVGLAIVLPARWLRRQSRNERLTVVLL